MNEALSIVCVCDSSDRINLHQVDIGQVLRRSSHSLQCDLGELGPRCNREASSCLSRSTIWQSKVSSFHLEHEKEEDSC